MRRSALLFFSLFFLLPACDDKPAAKATAPATAAAVDLAPPQTAAAGGGAVPGAIGAAAPKAVERFDTAEIVVPPGTSTLHIAWDLPKGTGVNDDAPVRVRFLESDGLIVAPTDLNGHGKDFASGFDVPLQIASNTTAAKLSGDVELVVCDVDTHSVCVPLKRRLEVTFGVQRGANPGALRLALPQAKRG
jgi:hypothetical protein